MPPRHGKSLTGSVRFPGWWLGRNPDKRLIGTAHTAGLAEDFSRRTRNELTQWGPEVFDVSVAGDSHAVDHWEIQGRRGGMVAAGVGGAIAGKGADLLLIDDPIKDAEAAESAGQRRKIVAWYQQDARPRLHPGGAIVLITTRWHEEDLAGFLLAEAKDGGEPWEQLCLPMLDDKGRILWPERYSPAEVEGIRRGVGTRAWSALYQQTPAPATGVLFKAEWFAQRYRIADGILFWGSHQRALSALDRVILSADCSFKDSPGSHPVAMHVYGQVGADAFLLDRDHGRMDLPATIARLLKLREKWVKRTTGVSGHRVTATYVEDKANGPAVVATLRDKVSGLIAEPVDGGKVARASAVTPMCEGGQVWMPDPKDAPWVADVLAQLFSFPFGMQDDDVDALSQGLNRLRHPATYIPKVGSPKDPGREVKH